MISWSPIWSMIVESSLWEEPYHVRVLFLTMLSLKDRDDIVRWDGYKLMKKANITPQECIEALKVLSSPDTRRKDFSELEEQEFEGRRIEKVDEGWLILNGAKYRALMTKMGRAEYKAEKQRKYREEERLGREASNPLPKQRAIGQETDNERRVRLGLPPRDGGEDQENRLAEKKAMKETECPTD